MLIDYKNSILKFKPSNSLYYVIDHVFLITITILGNEVFFLQITQCPTLNLKPTYSVCRSSCVLQVGWYAVALKIHSWKDFTLCTTLNWLTQCNCVPKWKKTAQMCTQLCNCISHFYTVKGYTEWRHDNCVSWSSDNLLFDIPTPTLQYLFFFNKHRLVHNVTVNVSHQCVNRFHIIVSC